MSQCDPPSTDSAKSVLTDSKRLVKLSREARKAARAARRRAVALLNLASTSRGGPGTVAAATTGAGEPGAAHGVERRRHDRLARPGRRQTDRRPRAADSRRVLLAGPDEGWRLLLAYLFEEAGYVVYAAENSHQVEAFSIRLLPDVVVVQMEIAGALDVVERLARAAGTFDIPVVVLIAAMHSADAVRVRGVGGVTLPPHDDDAEVLVGEVDTLIAVSSRARRSLKRRLLDLQELARLCTPDAEGQARLRRLIDHLQVAIFAVNTEGQCVAASQGAALLTGYSHLELLTDSVFESVFPDVHLASVPGLDLLEPAESVGTTTIVNHAGEHVTVYAAAVKEIMPGIRVAAVAAADHRPR